MEIAGRVAIVTGASSGIGAATAGELARLGASVVLAARRSDKLDTLVQEIEQSGGRALAVPTDVRKREAIDNLVTATLEHFGRIDIIINNAGTGAGGSIEDDDDLMSHIVEVNLLAPARLVQAALPQLRQHRGIVINVGSVAGEVAISGLYSATKFGLRGFNDALRREQRQHGIQVVLIAPGFIRTAMAGDVPVPMPGPEAVARSIVRAIRKPRRKIVVPGAYRLLIYVGQLCPWLVDYVIGHQRFQLRYKARKRQM